MTVVDRMHGVPKLGSRNSALRVALIFLAAFLLCVIGGRAIAADAAIGGPMDPLDAISVDHKADPEFQALFTSWKRLDQLTHGVIAIPSQKPVERMNFSSGFGVRTDPFRGFAAMHTGVDMPGPLGTPIHATADGVVDRAEWSNGYGKLIEINHGKGVQTRYGHLSQILVEPNQRVKRGDLIGLMGSTGRSTGNHLHYEVRIDGRAVNPMPFLQGADYLLAVQRRVASPGMAQVAQGGPETGTGSPD